MPSLTDALGDFIGDEIQPYSPVLATLAAFTIVQGQTYTPTVAYATTTPGDQVVATATGRYSRIGDLVFFRNRITLSNKGTGGVGALRISIPIAALAGGDESPVVVQTANIDFDAGWTAPQGIVINGTSYAMVYEVGDNVNRSPILWGNMTNTSTVYMAGQYFV